MVQFMNKGLITVLICFFILAGTNGCKDDYNSVVPYVDVNYNITPTNIIELNIPGGSYYFKNPGYGGLIIFRDLTDSSNPFLAFDGACTYDVPSVCRVVAEDDGGLVKCPCCGSEFILFGGNGSPTKGPATEPLKQYRTNYSNGLINVRN